ncbi:hypothetical protein ANCCAN_06229 [Ancylostoma caninum]|uniref:G-protein coupled receptors family 1 profile domain-containing protein n=1 Tax=Ancylostoma caninum TaxID=29170 RepID=A0A368GXA8_ANCCA|nr:hypothetical protein ANCCAN_06229 [Ancylostoma caninum]
MRNPLLSLNLLRTMPKTQPSFEETTPVSLNLPINSSLQLVPLGMIYSTLFLSLVQLRVLMLSGWYMIPNRHCYMVSIGGLLSLNVQAGMGLVLGIDRLLAVISPTRYNRPRSKLICCSMVFTVFIYSSLLTAYGYLYVSDSPTPVCLPPAAYRSTSRSVWVACNMCIAVIVILVYGTAHVKCRQLTSKCIQLIGSRVVSDSRRLVQDPNLPSIEKVKRLLCSLSLVVAVYTSTWFITFVGLVLTEVGIAVH